MAAKALWPERASPHRLVGGAARERALNSRIRVAHRRQPRPFGAVPEIQVLSRKIAVKQSMTARLPGRGDSLCGGQFCGKLTPAVAPVLLLFDHLEKAAAAKLTVRAPAGRG